MSLSYCLSPLVSDCLPLKKNCPICFNCQITIFNYSQLCTMSMFYYLPEIVFLGSCVPLHCGSVGPPSYQPDTEPSCIASHIFLCLGFTHLFSGTCPTAASWERKHGRKILGSPLCVKISCSVTFGGKFSYNN